MKNYTRHDLDNALSCFPESKEKAELIALIDMDKSWQPLLLKVLKLTDYEPSINSILNAIKEDDAGAFYCGDDWWAGDYLNDDGCAETCDEYFPIIFFYEGEKYYGTDYDVLDEYGE